MTKHALRRRRKCHTMDKSIKTSRTELQNGTWQCRPTHTVSSPCLYVTDNEPTQRHPDRVGIQVGIKKAAMSGTTNQGSEKLTCSSAGCRGLIEHPCRSITHIDKPGLAREKGHGSAGRLGSHDPGLEDAQHPERPVLVCRDFGRPNHARGEILSDRTSVDGTGGRGKVHHSLAGRPEGAKRIRAGWAGGPGLYSICTRKLHVCTLCPRCSWPDLATPNHG